MIQKFVDIFTENKEQLREVFAKEHPKSYKDIVKAVIELLTPNVEKLRYEGEDKPSPFTIHEINDGDYQGTLLYIIGACGYQPSNYWSVKVAYGSCSGCDTLQSIYDGYNEEDIPTKEQVEEYMTLALHIVQGLKEV